MYSKLGYRRAQNYLRYSQTLSAGGVWAVVGGAVVGSKVLAPDGSLTADSVTGNTDAWLYQTGFSSFTVGTLFCVSAWYRAGTPRTIHLEFLDIADGTPIHTLFCAVTTTWKRFSLAGVVGAGAGPNMTVCLGNRVGGFPTTYPIEMWGAQLEKGVTEPGIYRATGASSLF